jgi:hypothetical protein
MTPNGAAIFIVIVLAGALAASGPIGFSLLYAVIAAFALAEIGARAFAALVRAGLIVLPLAAFMVLVWVGFVGRSPAEIAAGVPGTRAAAATYVVVVCLRLFLIVLAIQLVVLRFDRLTPLQSICALRIPATAKRLLALTLSLTETLRHAVERARTALIAAGVITRRLSLRNLVNGWMLVQTVWLSAITIAVGRMRDKWPVEGTLGRLDDLFQRTPAQRLGARDAVWLLLGAVATVFGIGVGIG